MEVVEVEVEVEMVVEEQGIMIQGLEGTEGT